MNAVPGPRDLPRILGSYPEAEAARDGPLLIVVAGLHGNEPAGIHAVQRVMATLAAERPPIRGRILSLAGNVAALAAGRRFVARDLNRIWTEEEIDALRSGPSALDDAERGEQRELLAEIEAHFDEPWERVVVLDLHSISAQGAPFAIMGDTLANRRVAFELAIPVILGLEERVEGTLLSYVTDRGHVAVCVEGGKNELASTIDHHEAAIWVTAVGSGLLRSADVPRLDEFRRRLKGATAGLPPVVEIRYRQNVDEDAPFAMEPGYENFHPVASGEVLAHAGANVPVATPIAGLLLMPRYQGQGADGFFVGRPVRRFWLGFSAALRRTSLERCLPLLPGIRRAPGRVRTLLADTRVARWLVLEILHLFGYRRTVEEGRVLVFVRRRDT